MLCLPAPELTRIQQMHIAALFRLRSFIFSCYMDGPALAIVLGCDRAAAAGCAPGLPEVPDAQAGAKKRLRMPEPMPGPGPSKSAEKREWAGHVPCRQWVRGYFVQQPPPESLASEINGCVFSSWPCPASLDVQGPRSKQSKK